MKFSYSLLLLPLVALADLLPLHFQGNSALSDAKLYEALEIEVPHFFEFWKTPPSIDSKLLALSVEYLKSYYKSMGYYHASVTSTENNTTGITISIEEKRPINIENVEIVSKLKISEVVPFRTGMIFNAELFTQSKKEIKRHYSNKGFCNADVDAKSWIDIEEDKAYLLYTVTPNTICYFGKVDISTPSSINNEIIASFLKFHEGQVYSNEAVRQSYDSLYAQEGVAKVLIDVSDRKEKMIPVKVSVEEHEKPIRFNAGLGYSSDEGAEFSLGVKHRNFLSNLKTISLNGRYSEIQKSIKASYAMPFSNAKIFGAEIGYVDEKFEGYKERVTYETLYFNYYDKPHTLTSGIKFEHAITYDSQDDAIFKNSDLNIPSLLLGWHYDLRDKFLDPRKGYFLNTDVSGSVKSSISDASYLKYEISGGYIHSMGTSVLAARAKHGSIKVYEGDIPASYRFYAGGMNSNRAYAYRMLGPKNINDDPVGFSWVSEATLEYRFPILGNLRAILFNDTTFIGNSDSSHYDHAYVSVGAGLRYVTPIGPIALDFGVKSDDINQYAIHFHIGELF